MPNSAPQTDLLRKILTQFKCNCEVIHALKLMLADYEKQPPQERYPYSANRDRAQLAYLPGYTLLFVDEKLIMFYCLATYTIYDISQLVGLQSSGHYLRRLKADTRAAKTMQFRRI